MKVIAALLADLEVTPLGTRSRLADELAGVPVLRRTVERVGAARRIDRVYVLCPSTQRDRCADLLKGTPATVRGCEPSPAPWSALVRASRKWSLDGWRGGIGQTTCFDEYTDCRMLTALPADHGADALLSVPPAAAVVDPAIIDRMIELKESAEQDVRLVFTQSPPGLAGILLDADLVRELAEKNIPLGWTFSYQPDNPKKDLIFESCCLEVPAEVRYATGRLLADTDRSVDSLAALLGDHESPDITTAGRWLTGQQAQRSEPMPREVEIELTTDDPYPNTLLRPRGGRVGPRSPIDLGIIESVVDGISRYDDSLIVLGGFGDPLRHPRFTEILRLIRARVDRASVPYGLAVRTTAVDLTNDHIDAMIAAQVDVLNVTLDAWSDELYACLQDPDVPKRPSPADIPESDVTTPETRAKPALQQVLSNLDRLAQRQRDVASATPIVLPEMTKVRDNVHELDAFHDGWLRKTGAVSISGYSHHARQCQDRSVITMAPSTRTACRRIRSRCLVLADGRVAMCDQDLHGRHTAGTLIEQSLEDIWNSPAFEDVRQAHRAESYCPTPLCAACDDWHRP